MDKFTIRLLEQKDDQLLAEMIREVFREFKIDLPGTVYTDPTTDHLSEVFQAKGSAYFLAEQNQTILGGCGFYPTNGLPNGCAELVKFYLRPESRCLGIGRSLMEMTFEEAKKLGYTQLYLESFPELNQAVGMYTKAGFKMLSNSMGNTGHYACKIWMLKDL